MNATDRVIEKFNGITGLANALGHTNTSTVQGWKERGIVPSRHIPLILKVAKKAEPVIPLTHSDFFE